MSSPEKVKVCFGNMFIKFPKLKTTEMIHKGNKSLQCIGKSYLCVFAVGASTTSVVFLFTDQQQLDEEINALHKGLKEKFNRLNEIQGVTASFNHC